MMKAWIMQIAVSLVLASTFIYLWNASVSMHRDISPVSDWMEVNDLIVPDHKEGDDPAIIYDRTIHHRFAADWVAEVNQLQAGSGGYAENCTGHGSNIYKPTDVLPEPVLLSWIMDETCLLEPGQYRLCAFWKIRPEGFPVKHLEKCSLPFTVLTRDLNGE